MNIFSLLIGFGASLGLWQVARKGPEQSAEDRVLWGLILLGFSLLGARSAYVLMNLAYFDQNRLSALAFWEGGLNWFGAVVGALLACLGLSVWHGISPLKIADSLFPLLPCLSIPAWLGCWADHCNCVPLSNDTQAGSCSMAVRPISFPTGISVALTLLTYFFYLEANSIRNPSQPAGSLPAWGMLGFALIQLAASLFETGLNPAWSGYSNTWAAVGCLGISLVMLIGVYLPRLISQKMQSS